MSKDKLTVPDIVAMKKAGERITMLTAYDVSFARMLDSAGVEILLVGDSLGMVVLGYESTVPVTMDEMIHHSKAVNRGRERALLVGRIPHRWPSFRRGCLHVIQRLFEGYVFSQSIWWQRES